MPNYVTLAQNWKEVIIYYTTTYISEQNNNSMSLSTSCFPGEKYFNFCQGLPAWLHKFSNYSLISIHPTYHFHIAFVLKVQKICLCFVAKIWMLAHFQNSFHWVAVCMKLISPLIVKLYNKEFLWFVFAYACNLFIKTIFALVSQYPSYLCVRL
jgi:hypothetical protein